MPTETVAGALAAAEREDLGAFWQLCRDRAEHAAAELERRREAGEGLGPLAGVPFAVKDNLDLAGTPTTSGLPGTAPAAQRDAEAVARLERAGAVAIGKTAMDPLGWTMRGEAPGRPPCLNPLDDSLSPGGSSAGSAAAVSAGIVPLALGTDAAGSIRVPAAYCGIVGLKPARGAVPRRGSLAVVPSFDVVGILARSVADCRLAHEILTGKPLEDSARELRVGLLEDLLEASEPSVAQACERVARELSRALGIEIEPVRLDWQARGFGRVLAAELAEHWGERIAAEPDRFSDAIRESAERGSAITTDALKSANREMTTARRRLATRFAPFDALLCPTVPTPVPRREEQDVEGSSRHTRPFSALGWPAISVPAGRDRQQRPLSVQVAGAPRKLAGILAVAAAIEGGNPAPAAGDHR